MGRVAVAVLGIALVIGLKFYNKSSDGKAVKEQLVQLCEGDAKCLQAVQTHFEACFDSAYKMGGRRRAAHLEAEQLVQCLNTRAGQPYFASAK